MRKLHRKEHSAPEGRHGTCRWLTPPVRSYVSGRPAVFLSALSALLSTQ